MIYLQLLGEFLKIGMFTFGGAYGAIPLIQQSVLGQGWMDEAMFANIIAVSESTPGPIMVNAATYVGNLQGGVPGAAIATLGAVFCGALTGIDHVSEGAEAPGCKRHIAWCKTLYHGRYFGNRQLYGVFHGDWLCSSDFLGSDCGLDSRSAACSVSSLQASAKKGIIPHFIDRFFRRAWHFIILMHAKHHLAMRGGVSIIDLIACCCFYNDKDNRCNFPGCKRRISYVYLQQNHILPAPPKALWQ